MFLLKIIRLITLLASIPVIDAGGQNTNGGGNGGGSGGGGNVNQGENVGNGNSGPGGPLMESHQCYPQTDSLAIASAAKTQGACKDFYCPRGCCRYHTAFLTCDIDNNFVQQPCICNELTNPNLVDRSGSTSGTTGGGSTINVLANSTLASPANPPTPTTVQLNINPSTCENGSPWQNLYLPFTNCTTTPDCANVTEANGRRRTCCKKTFCWCGSFDIAEAECV
jgi:hypothetical protein